VYVDGYMVGSVDDFDGTFQRLRVPPGAHELTLYRDGFKTVHQSLRLSQGSTFKVSYTMEPLAAGEVAEPRPTPPPPPPDEGEGAGRPSARAVAGFGTLAIRVQPAEAVVLIDGERWQSSAQDRLIVEVPEGPHRVEIVKEGFDTYSTEITVGPGQTLPINVSLRSR
jgi:PEGA domain-containing protein